MTALKLNGDSYRAQCLKQLDLFRSWLSDNDAALHWRYRAYLHATGKAPDYNKPSFMVYQHASKMREMLYFDAYDSIRQRILTADRGEYFFSWEWANICVSVIPDEFSVTFNAR